MTALEGRIRAIKRVDLYDPVRAARICLVLNVVILKRFRVPKFIKYIRTQCPITHLKSYCNKMTEVVHDKKLLMHFFQDSLSGAVLSWYMRLDNTRIRRWKDVVEAFVRQYKYNMNISPDRTSLSNLEKGDKESIREYAQRWKDLAVQVHPSFFDKEMVTLFVNTLKPSYYEHVMGSSLQQFTNVVVVVERIEKGVKSDRISALTEKRGFKGKRREVDHVEDGCRGRKNQFQNYHTPSQIANINLNSSFPTKKPESLNFQAKSQIENFQKKNYQMVQEQLAPFQYNKSY